MDDAAQERRRWRLTAALIAVIALGIVLRAALVTFVAPYPERYIQADAVQYDQLARNLLAGNGFSVAHTPPFLPNNRRAPLFPVTIALVYSAGFSSAAVLCLEVVLGTVTVVMAYVVAALVGGHGAGLWAAALLALCPTSITYTAVLWAETQFTMLLTLSVLVTLIMLSRPHRGWLLLAALTAGLATLTHVRVLYLPLLLAGVLLVTRRRRRVPMQRALLDVGLYLALYLAVLLPWVMRNYVTFGVLTFTSAGQVDLLRYGAAVTEAARTGEEHWVIADRYRAEVRELSPTKLNEAEYGRLAARVAARKIAEHPVHYAIIHLTGMVRTFLPTTFAFANLVAPGGSANLSNLYRALTLRGGEAWAMLWSDVRAYPLAVWAFIGFQLIYLPCVYLLALSVLLRRDRAARWVGILALIVLYLTAVPGAVGAPRFRVAMMPLLCTLAAAGLPRRWRDPLEPSRAIAHERR